ncbi:MAG: hypothetical protein QOI80_2914, partial [Solirubrobacteraceae bacterium]|nr:hypothetical protein [Solirubrobacteraceae bacterium]
LAELVDGGDPLGRTVTIGDDFRF